jgi:RNA polymerase sigma-70 factor (ECF subfamily)
MARRLTRSEADAEDLVQATVVRAIEHRAELRDNERMRAWLLRVQRTVLLNGRRGLANRLELVHDSATLPEPQGDLETELLERELPDELTRALGRLPAEHREALLLREVEGLSYQEIAEIQHCPMGTVRSRIARARLALGEALASKNERSSWTSALKSGS